MSSRAPPARPTRPAATHVLWSGWRRLQIPVGRPGRAGPARPRRLDLVLPLAALAAARPARLDAAADRVGLALVGVRRVAGQARPARARPVRGQAVGGAGPARPRPARARVVDLAGRRVEQG